jgi:hypothetical protein
MNIEKPSRRKRYHQEEFKQAVVEACCEPGVMITLSHFGSEERSCCSISPIAASATAGADFFTSRKELSTFFAHGEPCLASRGVKFVL